jgi:hypothetical protein
MVGKFQYSALSKSWFSGRVESNRGRWNWMASLEVTLAPHLSVRVVSDLYMHMPSMTDNGGRGEITKQRKLMVTNPNHTKRIRFGTIRMSS